MISIRELLKRYVEKGFPLDYVVRRGTRNYDAKLMPSHIAIETTNYCNARCLFCPNSIHKRKRGVMDMNTFKRIIDDAKKNDKVEFITHGGLGEPLFDPEIATKISYEKKNLKKVTVQLHTNASLLSENCINNLFESGLNILSISVNAFFKDTYDKIVGLDYAKIKENIEKVIKLKKKLNSRTEIRVTCVKSKLLKEKEDKMFQEYWQNRVDKVTVLNMQNWATYLKMEFGHTKCYPCKWIWSILVFDYSGNARLCMADYEGLHVLGNIANNTIEEIYNNKKIRDLRKAHHDRQFHYLDICKDCSELYIGSNYWLTPNLKHL